MNPKYLTLIIAALSLATAIGEDRIHGVSREGIDTLFEADAVLTDAEVAVVADLARQRGLPSVKQVLTYNIHLTADHVIKAISQDVITGSEYTIHSVSINYDKWSPGGRKNQKILKSIGDFWVAKSDVEKTRGAKLQTRHGEIRVMLRDDTQLDFADKVVAAINAGKLRFKEASLKKSIEDAHADVSKPVAISMADKGKKCYLSLSLGRSLSGMEVECTMDEDGGLTVVAANVWNL